MSGIEHRIYLAHPGFAPRRRFSALYARSFVGRGGGSGFVSVAQEREHENALGDEIGEAFDFGIGI